MNLTANDICLIIESCHKNDVQSCEISQDTLKVVFASKPIAVENSTATQPSVPTTETTFSLPENAEDPEDLREEQDNAELLINDPLKYEELVASGELVDEQNKND